MNEEQRFLLLTHRKVIEKDLLVGDVFSYLQSKLVIDYDDVELIKNEITSKRKAEKLIDILLQKRRNAYNHFYDALKYAEYNHLSLLLDEGATSDISSHSSEDENGGDLPDISTILKNGGVPKMPPIFVERPDCLKILHDSLHQLRNGDGWVVLHGMGGCGKTVLAANALNDEELVHSCFPRGVFWVTIGNVDEARLLMKIQNLCSWLDTERIYSIPKNLEEGRDRLRILFSQDYPRCLLVLDDLWSDTYAKYFDINVRTLATTRYAGVANKINGLVIKVPISDGLNFLQSQQILSKWTDISVINLPPEATQIINICQGSPLAIAMIGALLKNHNNRWDYYLNQLENQKTSKVRSKLNYQYASLYDAVAVSFDELNEDLKSFYEKLSVFEEDVPIPLNTLMIFGGLDEVETEDMMDELIERSLITSSTTSEGVFYNIHDIQLSFLKEKASQDSRIANFHNIFVDSYLRSCNNNFNMLEKDGYIHFYLTHHLLEAARIKDAIRLHQDFDWIQNSNRVTGPAIVIAAYKKLLKYLEDKIEYKDSADVLQDMCHLISTMSHVLSRNKNVDFVQLALCVPTSQKVYGNALQYAKKKIKRKKAVLYYEWTNRPKRIENSVVLTIHPHSGSVNACQFSHSSLNERIVTCGADKMIKIWNAVTGEHILNLDGHTGAVNYCEFTPDDRKVISCSADKSIKIWSSFTGQELSSIRGHSADVLCCKCSSDGKYIVSSAIDHLTKIWYVDSGTLYRTFDEHTDVVNWCCFSPDNMKVASVSNDLTLKVHDVENDMLSFTCGGDHDFILYCLFTSDGNQIVSCSQNHVLVYSATNGSCLWKLNTPSDVLSLSLSPDNRFLALAQNDTFARLYDLENRVFVQLFAGHSSWLNDVSFCKQGRKIITGCYDGTCKIWDVKPSSFPTEKLRKVFDAHFDNNGDVQLAAATSKHQIYSINSSGEKICESKVFLSKVSVCSFSSEGKYTAVGCYDGSVAVLLANDMKHVFNCQKHFDKVNHVTFSSSGQLLVSGGDDSRCIVWNVTGHISCEFDGHTERITNCLFFNNDQKILSSSFDGFLHVWDAQNGNILFSCHDNDNNDAILSCAVSHNETFLVSSTAGSHCKLWSSNQGELLRSLGGDSEPYRCVVFSYDDSMVAVGKDDGTATLWDIAGESLGCDCEGDENEEDRTWIMDLKFNKKSNMLVTAGNNIKWFDVKGNHLQTYHIVGSFVRSICCMENFDLCVTIDDLGFMYLIRKVSSGDDLKMVQLSS